MTGKTAVCLQNIMIKNREILERFDRELLAKEPCDYHKAVKIFEELQRYARLFGHFKEKDMMEGIEVDIKIARAVNSVK